MGKIIQNESSGNKKKKRGLRKELPPSHPSDSESEGYSHNQADRG